MMKNSSCDHQFSISLNLFGERSLEIDENDFLAPRSTAERVSLMNLHPRTHFNDHFTVSTCGTREN